MHINMTAFICVFLSFRLFCEQGGMSHKTIPIKSFAQFKQSFLEGLFTILKVSIIDCHVTKDMYRRSLSNDGPSDLGIQMYAFLLLSKLGGFYIHILHLCTIYSIISHTE